MTRSTFFDRMRRDHRNVLERVSALERGLLRTRPPSKDQDHVIRNLIAHLERQFATHMAGEDRVLFPELTPVLPSGESSLAPLRAEHEELRAMLERLQQTLRRRPGSARDEEITIQVRDLIDLLRLHIRKEEIVLGVAERVLTPREIDGLEARVRALTHSPGGRS